MLLIDSATCCNNGDWPTSTPPILPYKKSTLPHSQRECDKPTNLKILFANFVVADPSGGPHVHQCRPYFQSLFLGAFRNRKDLLQISIEKHKPIQQHLVHFFHHLFALLKAHLPSESYKYLLFI